MARPPSTWYGVTGRGQLGRHQHPAPPARRRAAAPAGGRAGAGRLFGGAGAPGPSRARRQGGHRVERHGRRRPGRGRRRLRPPGMDRRRPRRSPVSSSQSLRGPSGRWLRSWQGGRAGRNLAVAADYAWLVEALHPAGGGHRPGRLDRRGPGGSRRPPRAVLGRRRRGPVHHRERRRAADRAVQGHLRRGHAIGQLGGGRRPPATGSPDRRAAVHGRRRRHLPAPRAPHGRASPWPSPTCWRPSTCSSAGSPRWP